MGPAVAAALLRNPKVQEMIVEKGMAKMEGQIDKVSSRYSKQQDEQEQEEEEEEEEERPKKKKKKSKKKSKKDDDDDDEDADEDADEDEDEKEEKEEKERLEKVAEMKKVKKGVTLLYDLDRDNAIKFKRAYYNSTTGDIKKFNVKIDYKGVPTTIYKIRKRNNKIFSIYIMKNNQSIEISRSNLMIEGTPVSNRSIINKIMEVCFNVEIIEE